MRSLDRGTSPLLTVRVPRELLNELDRECQSFCISRSALLRQILQSAMDRARTEDAK